MNKKLIVTAMGLVMAGTVGLANADIKLYGQLDVSTNWTDSDVGTDDGTRRSRKVGQDGTSYQDDINMKSNTSAIGVKGSEDLGNGLSAFFKVEWDADLVNGGDFKGRDQFIGLKMQRFGKLTFGTMSTAYKSPGSKIDAFYRTPIQSRAIGLQSNLHSGKGEEGQGRATNTVRYDSPKFFGGLSLMGTYTLDSDKQDQAAPVCSEEPDCEDDDPYSLGVQWAAGNFYAAASYISTQRDQDAEAAQFLARYNWNNLSFHGIYELDQGLITAQANNGIGQNSNNGGQLGRSGFARDDGADIWSLGATFTIGNNLLAFDFGHRDNNDGVNGVNDSSLIGGGTTYDDIQEYDVWRLAAYHKFSNRTRIYAGFSNTDYNHKGEDEIFAVGMRHNF
jgi:predicted porin